MIRLLDFFIEFLAIALILMLGYLFFSFIFAVVHHAISTGEYANIKIFFSIVMLFVCYAYIRTKVKFFNFTKKNTTTKPRALNNVTIGKIEVEATEPEKK